ncbi:MAG: eCIS core domain-containing protein [Acidimicrobiia bacterium]
MASRRLTAEERVSFVHVPALDRARVRVVVVRRLTPGTAGVTLGRWVLLRRDQAQSRGLLAHEMVHVRQWRERGVIRFLAAYLGEYVRGRRHGLGHRDAYRAISFEAEARALSAGLGAG